MNFRDQVLHIIGSVPPGQVVTYGQVAALAGFPRRPRQVGQVLKNCPLDVPWQRVVGAGGQLRLQPVDAQAELLRAEGVAVLGARVDLRHYQWRPGPLAFA